MTDGSYTMRFRIYDAANSGTLKWDSGNHSVTVSGGVFSVVLGETPQPIVNLPFDEDYWLEVTVDGNVQSPRNRLGSVGYAYMASGVVPGTEVSGSVTTSPFAAIKGAHRHIRHSLWSVWDDGFPLGHRGEWHRLCHHGRLRRLWGEQLPLGLRRLLRGECVRGGGPDGGRHTHRRWSG